jgi:hypothetical protein
MTHTHPYPPSGGLVGLANTDVSSFDEICRCGMHGKGSLLEMVVGFELEKTVAVFAVLDNPTGFDLSIDGSG